MPVGQICRTAVVCDTQPSANYATSMQCEVKIGPRLCIPHACLAVSYRRPVARSVHPSGIAGAATRVPDWHQGHGDLASAEDSRSRSVAVHYLSRNYRSEN